MVNLVDEVSVKDYNFGKFERRDRNRLSLYEVVWNDYEMKELSGLALSLVLLLDAISGPAYGVK